MALKLILGFCDRQLQFQFVFCLRERELGGRKRWCGRRSNVLLQTVRLRVGLARWRLRLSGWPVAAGTKKPSQPWTAHKRGRVITIFATRKDLIRGPWVTRRFREPRDRQRHRLQQLS